MNTWTLPDLRIDRDGDWYDDGVQITHPGVIASLRRCSCNSEVDAF